MSDTDGMIVRTCFQFPLKNLTFFHYIAFKVLLPYDRNLNNLTVVSQSQIVPPLTNDLKRQQCPSLDMPEQ